MRTDNRGFTLIELMITVAIVAILAAIAYPSYRNQVMRSNRTDAKVALMQSAQDLEKCYTQYASYNNANCAAKRIYPSSNGYYTIDASTNVSAQTYSLAATPIGTQANDTACASFGFDNTNNKSAKNNLLADNTTTCWK